MRIKSMQLVLIPLLLTATIVAFVTTLPLAASPHWSRTTNNVIVNFTPENVVLTDTQTLTPTRSMLTLNPSTELTLTLSVGGAISGDQLVVVSEVVTVTNVQTNNTTLATAQIMSQNDVLVFVLANGQWINVDIVDNLAD